MISRRLPARAADVFATLTERGGRVALFGAAGRFVIAREADPLGRVVLERLPWGGAAAFAFVEEAGATTLSAEPLEGAVEGAEDALGATLDRLAAHLGGVVLIEAVVAASAAACWSAWTDPDALRAALGVEVEQDLRALGKFAWRAPVAGDPDETGRFLAVDERRALDLEWARAPGTHVEVAFHGGLPGDPTLVTLTHAGFAPRDLAAARAAAERWLARVDRLRDYAEGAARAEREILATRERLEAALDGVRAEARTGSKTPGFPPTGREAGIALPPGATIELGPTGEAGGVLARVERAGLPEARRPEAFANALAAAELALRDLAARASGTALGDAAPIGPVRVVEEVVVAAAPAAVFEAIASDAARERWMGRVAGRRAIGLLAPRALEEVWPLDHDAGVAAAIREAAQRNAWRADAPAASAVGAAERRPLATVRFDVEPLAPSAPGGRARALVRVAHDGFPLSAEGGIAARAERLAWALRLLQLRATLERGLDLRARSRTARLYPDEVDVEATLDAPPAEVAAAIARGAGERGEILVSTDGATEVVCARPLADAEEVALVTYTLARVGPRARLRAVERGFTEDEEFWTLEEKFRLIPAMALARGEASDRLAAVAAALSREFGPLGALRLERELAAPAEAVYAALTEAARLAIWLGGTAASEPWPGGRLAWNPRGAGRSERADRGAYLDVEPGRRLVLALETTPRPALVELAVGPGGRLATRLRVELVGLPPALVAAEDARWETRLDGLAAFVEGRLERSVEIAAPVDRVFAALRDEAALRAWLEPGARADLGADEPALLLTLQPGLGVERCAVLASEPPRRLALAWPVGRGDGGGENRLEVVLDALEPGRARATFVETGFAESFGKPALFRAEGERLSFYARSLAALCEGKGGLVADAQGSLRLGGRSVELAAEVPLQAAEAYERIAGRIRSVFGRALEETPPRRLVALAPGAAGEPPGLTIVTVEVEPAGPFGARVRVLEEGFREGDRWDERLATEERGFGALLSELCR